MRVLMVNKFHYYRGGSETYHFAVAEALEKRGHEVAFFSMDDPDNLPCEQSKFFVRGVDYTSKASPVHRVRDAFALVYSLEARRKFEELLQEFRPDVIHLNLVHRQLSFSILDAPSVQGIPIVYTAHDYVPVCPNSLMMDNSGELCCDCLGGNFRNCMRKKCIKESTAKSALAVIEAEFIRMHGSYGVIDRFIAPSETMKGMLSAGGIPAEKIALLRNFSIDAASRQDIVSREKRFLYFGRLSPEKGIDTIIAAFIAASDYLPADWQLDIAGDGPERPHLEAIVAEYGMENRVRFLGRVGRDEVAGLIAGTSFAVIASRWLENMPYSIIEAFCAGTPVIGSGIGGILELVADGKTGLLFEPDSVEGLASRMLEAANMAESDYCVMQENCRAYIEANCDRDDYMDALVSLYEKVIDEKREKAHAVFD